MGLSCIDLSKFPLIQTQAHEELLLSQKTDLTRDRNLYQEREVMLFLSDKVHFGNGTPHPQAPTIPSRTPIQPITVS